MTETPSGIRDRAIYHGLWSVLVRWFRVPRTPPSLPAQVGAAPRSFRPDPAFLRYLRAIYWFLAAIIVLPLAVAAVVVTIAALVEGGTVWLGVGLTYLTLFLTLVGFVLAFLAIHLRYDTTWYVMTDRSLRIRRGIWVIREMTVTFENVQNVKVERGPVQQLFDIASLVVETAGAGSGGKHGGIDNRALIEGVRTPEELRDGILARMRGSRTTGLGDEEEDRSDAPRFSAAHVAVLREIRDALATAAAGGARDGPPDGPG